MQPEDCTVCSICIENDPVSHFSAIKPNRFLWKGYLGVAIEKSIYNLNTNTTHSQ